MSVLGNLLKAVGITVGGLIGIAIAAVVVIYGLTWLMMQPPLCTIILVVIVTGVVFLYLHGKNAS